MRKIANRLVKTDSDMASSSIREMTDLKIQ